MTAADFINYTLAFLMWLVFGRAVLSLWTTNMGNPIYALFYRATEPIYRVARRVVPRGTTFVIIIVLIILRILVIKLGSHHE